MKRVLYIIAILAVVGYAAHSAYVSTTSQLQRSVAAQAEVLRSIEKGLP